MAASKEFLRVGIFDSGFGSLSIAKAIRQKMPFLELIVCADNKHFPYGTKSESEVLRHVLDSIETTLQDFSLDMIVIACNTASTIVLPELRKRYSIPIIGVVPAIKTAVKLSKTKRIGLLATQGTINRDYTDNLVKKFAEDYVVRRLGSSRLVEMAEQKICGISPSLEVVKDELLPFFQDEEKEGILDTIVLGSTHFPLLLPELQKAVPHPIIWVDSGEAIARRVESLLEGQVFNSRARGKTILTFTSQTIRRDVSKELLENEGIELFVRNKQLH